MLSESPNFVREIFDFAAMKLVCTRADWFLMDTEDFPQRSAAVLSSRLALELHPGRQSSRELEAALVASHMRLVYCVPTHGEYMYTGHSSEPILAEAAAKLHARALQPSCSATSVSGAWSASVSCASAAYAIDSSSSLLARALYPRRRRTLVSGEGN